MNGALTAYVNWLIQGYALRRLTPSTAYTIKVVARDSSGNTADSNSVSVTISPAPIVRHGRRTNRFVVQAVDRAGNTSSTSNAATAELWIC